MKHGNKKQVPAHLRSDSITVGGGKSASLLRVVTPSSPTGMRGRGKGGGKGLGFGAKDPPPLDTLQKKPVLKCESAVRERIRIIRHIKITKLAV